MDLSDYISVRYHFNGEFISQGMEVYYVGGKEEMSFVEREKLSMDELWRHLQLHYLVVEGQQLHWLFPGKVLSNGLMMLTEENMVAMSKYITDCGVVEIYVEDPIVDDQEAVQWEVKEDSNGAVEEDKCGDDVPATDSKEDEKKKKAEGEDSSDDSDFVPADSSSDDDEVVAIKQNYKKFKEEKMEEQNLLETECAALEDIKEEVQEDSSEDNESYDEDSDGQLANKSSQYARYNKGRKLTLGMKFCGKKEFKDAIISYGLAERREIKFIKDEGDRVRAKCTWANCPWVCLCKKTTRCDSWQITSYNDRHFCPKRRDSSLVTSTRIADKFENMIKANPEWTALQLKASVQEEMFANCHISKIKRAKAIVVGRMLDSKSGEYSHIFETWDWFCSLLFNDLKIGDGDGWVIISDQQKGILNAVQNWVPRAEHRNCARHIYANWRKNYRDKKWQKLFWGWAKASSPMLFNLARAKLAQETVEGALAIMKTDPHHWSRAWFRLGSDCDSVDNNISESFNKWIIEARCLPVISSLENIRQKVMIRIQENKTESEKWHGNICPNVLRKLKKSIDSSAYCHAIWNGCDGYEVKHEYSGHRFSVNIKQRTCSCGYWQLSGLPCPHAIYCIYMETNKLDDYISKSYTVESFKKTYAHCLQPVEGQPAWPVSDRPRPEGPKEIKKPGRKKKQRTREEQEKPKTTRVSKVGTVIKCSLCKGTGHNKTSCYKRHGIASASNGARTESANPPVMASQKSTSSSTAAAPDASKGKRKMPSENSNKTAQAESSKRSSKKTNNTNGNTINVHGFVQGSQSSSSVTVNVSSGSAFAQATNNHGRCNPRKKHARTRKLLGFKDRGSN